LLRYDTIDDLQWKNDTRAASLIQHINYKTTNVLHRTEKVNKHKNHETDGYGRDKRLEIEKLKKKK